MGKPHPLGAALRRAFARVPSLSPKLGNHLGEILWRRRLHHPRQPVQNGLLNVPSWITVRSWPNGNLRECFQLVLGERVIPALLRLAQRMPCQSQRLFDLHTFDGLQDVDGGLDIRRTQGHPAHHVTQYHHRAPTTLISNIMPDRGGLGSPCAGYERAIRSASRMWANFADCHRGPTLGRR